MRRWLRALGVLLALLLILGVYVRLFAGGPVRVFPGGWLRGEVEAEPVSSWSFARDEQYAQVESRARWLPYSTTVWFMVQDDDFYILLPSLFGDGLHRRLQEDPHVRVRVKGVVYPQVAVPFEGEENLAALLTPFLRRTMAVEISGPVRRVDGADDTAERLDAQVWIYRLENPKS